MTSVLPETRVTFSSVNTEEKIVMGAAVNLLSINKQEFYAEKISARLSQYPELTKPRIEAELLRDMREARAVLYLNPDNQDLFAFGKIEYYGVNEARQVLYEFGSWICFRGNGYGRQVLEAARDLAAEQYPFARLIAIVRSCNLKAQDIITESGGSKVGYIEPGMKHIYDITRRQHPTEVIRMVQGGVWIR